jgi:hypothetical protein
MARHGTVQGSIESSLAAIRMIRRFVIKHLAALLALVSTGLAAVRTRAVLWPWMTESAKLFAGTLAYNIFALFIVQPLLRRWFPPLKPWEHVSGLLGDSRMTYEEIVPVVATTLWILGNALLIVMMNRRLRSTRESVAAGGAVAGLDIRPRPGR